MILSPTEVACYLKAAGATAAEAAQLLSHVPNESGFNTEAENTNAPCSSGGNHAVGLFQICNFSDRVTQFGDLKDPTNNSRAAVSILRNQGIGAWDSTPSGDYSSTVLAVYNGSQSCNQLLWSPGPGLPNDPGNTLIPKPGSGSGNPFDALGNVLAQTFNNWQTVGTRVLLTFLGVVVVAIGILILMYGDLKRAAIEAAKVAPIV